MIVTHNGDGLAAPEEFHAFFTGVVDFAFGAGHVGFIAAVGAGDARRALTDGGAGAVHGGIAAA